MFWIQTPMISFTDSDVSHSLCPLTGSTSLVTLLCKGGHQNLYLTLPAGHDELLCLETVYGNKDSPLHLLLFNTLIPAIDMINCNRGWSHFHLCWVSVIQHHSCLFGKHILCWRKTYRWIKSRCHLLMMTRVLGHPPDETNWLVTVSHK